jgi:hypothetical protein
MPEVIEDGVVNATDRTLKAFICSCEGECGAMVVFAVDRDDARRNDTRDCECEFIDRRYRRASGFDELAPGPVTYLDYLQRGWTFECQECGHYVDQETSGRAVGAANVFCSAECFEKFKAIARRMEALPGPLAQRWVDTLRELNDVQVVNNANAE